MTDIERLYKMQAESDRLNRRIQMAEAARDAANSLAKRRSTEIEQLRAVGECYQTECNDLRDELDGARAEIERLREENNKLRSDAVALQDMRQKAEAEVENLREVEATAMIIFATNREQRHEIERLKEELTEKEELLRLNREWAEKIFNRDE